jgi:hypothetical protein
MGSGHGRASVCLRSTKESTHPPPVGATSLCQRTSTLREVANRHSAHAAHRPGRLALESGRKDHRYTSCSNANFPSSLLHRAQNARAEVRGRRSWKAQKGQETIPRGRPTSAFRKRTIHHSGPSSSSRRRRRSIDHAYSQAHPEGPLASQHARSPNTRLLVVAPCRAPQSRQLACSHKRARISFVRDSKQF